LAGWRKPAGQWRRGPVYVTDARDPTIAVYTAPDAADVPGQTLMIARQGVRTPEFPSIEAWLGRAGNTWEYYRSLASRGAVYQPAQDVSSWVRFNLTAYHEQAQAVRNRIERSSRVRLILSDFAASAGMDERVTSALHDVAMTSRVRRLRYEHAEGLSLQQAQRDLRDLVSAELLIPVGRTRARYYTEGSRFPEAALTEAQTPRVIARPYPG
jgi:hypothetical protein